MWKLSTLKSRLKNVEYTEKCGGEYTEKCGGEYTEKCGGEYTEKCGGEYTEKCGGEYTEKCGDEYTEKCGDEHIYIFLLFLNVLSASKMWNILFKVELSIL